MATTEFSYGESAGRSYPIIPIHLRNSNKEFDMEALVDSGASISTFRADVAEHLGLQIENGEKRTSVGISGKVDVYLHEIEIKIFERWFTCRIAFSKQITTSFNLLGREGFFEKHLVTFNEKERKLVVTEF